MPSLASTLSHSSLGMPSVILNDQNYLLYCMQFFRSAATEKCSTENFAKQIKNSLLFSESTASVLRQVWGSEGPALLALPKTALSVGEVGNHTHWHASVKIIFYIYSCCRWSGNWAWLWARAAVRHLMYLTWHWNWKWWSRLARSKFTVLS